MLSKVSRTLGLRTPSPANACLSSSSIYSQHRWSTTDTTTTTTPHTAGTDNSINAEEQHHHHQEGPSSSSAAAKSTTNTDSGERDDGNAGAASSSSTATEEGSSPSIFSKGAVDAEIIAFSKRIFNLTAKGARNLDLHESVHVDKRIEKRDVRTVGADEGISLEMQKLKSNFEQKGAFGGYQKKDVMVHEVDNRKRRVTSSVPFIDPITRVANETSFRRLPKNCSLPKEAELRGLYPLTTGLVLSMGEAHCADANASDIDAEPEPIKYVKLLPKNYDKNRCYPHMVVLADGRGMPVDFEDVCANWFERPVVAQGLAAGDWVVFCPAINVKISWHTPQEAIVARFCDWVVENHNVENNRVHLFGKGYGAYCAIRTCLEHPNVALSVVAIFGRGGTPYRVQDNVRNKVKHLDGVHILSYTPGLLWKQDWIYKFKYMMDESNNRPAMRNIHYEGVFDHQIYYAINPYEFWNYMNFFRKYNCTMLTDGKYRHMDEAVRHEALDAKKKAKEERGEKTTIEDDWSFYSPPAFTTSEINNGSSNGESVLSNVKEMSEEDWEVKFGEKDEEGAIKYQGDSGSEDGTTTGGRGRRGGNKRENVATSL